MKTAFLYQDENREWRWKVVNGKKFESQKIIGASTEGYKRRNTCIKNYITIVGLEKIPLYDARGAQKQITKATGLGY